jgi:hypothetical protein
MALTMLRARLQQIGAMLIVGAMTSGGCESAQDGDEPASIEQCLAESDASGCEALGCRWHETLAVDATTCTTSAGGGRCFTLGGDPVGQAAEVHAYHRLDGDQLELMLYGYDCAVPLGWTECTTGAESPAECACLCATTIDGETVYCGQSPLCD